MPVTDLARFTDDELIQEIATTGDQATRAYIARLLRDRAASRPGISGLTAGKIEGLLPSVTDQPARDALVQVLWARAARQARAEHAATRTEDEDDCDDTAGHRPRVRRDDRERGQDL